MREREIEREREREIPNVFCMIVYTFICISVVNNITIIQILILSFLITEYAVAVYSNVQ